MSDFGWFRSGQADVFHIPWWAAPPWSCRHSAESRVRTTARPCWPAFWHLQSSRKKKKVKVFYPRKMSPGVGKLSSLGTFWNVEKWDARPVRSGEANLLTAATGTKLTMTKWQRLAMTWGKSFKTFKRIRLTTVCGHSLSFTHSQCVRLQSHLSVWKKTDHLSASRVIWITVSARINITDHCAPNLTSWPKLEDGLKLRKVYVTKSIVTCSPTLEMFSWGNHLHPEYVSHGQPSWNKRTLFVIAERSHFCAAFC